MSSAEFEPAISVIEQMKVYVFHGTATFIGLRVVTRNNMSGMQKSYITAKVAGVFSPHVVKYTKFQKNQINVSIVK